MEPILRGVKHIKPGKTKVAAKIIVTDEDLERIIESIKNNDKHVVDFDIDVFDASNEVIAKVKRCLMSSKKQEKALRF